MSDEKKKYKIDMSKERWWTEEEIRQAAVEDLAGCALGISPEENHAQAREQRGTTDAAWGGGGGKTGIRGDLDLRVSSSGTQARRRRGKTGMTGLRSKGARTTASAGFEARRGRKTLATARS